MPLLLRLFVVLEDTLVESFAFGSFPQKTAIWPHETPAFLHMRSFHSANSGPVSDRRRSLGRRIRAATDGLDLKNNSCL